MKKKTVCAGFVGAEFSTSFHDEALRKVHDPDVEVADVFVTNAAMAAAYVKQPGIRAFDGQAGSRKTPPRRARPPHRLKPACRSVPPQGLL